MTIDERATDWLAERYWREEAVLARAREAFAEHGPLIEVPRDSAAALATLVRVSGARRVLEIGTLFGYSAAWMLRALPADGHLDTLELEDAHADAAEALLAELGVADRATVHRGPAGEVLARLAGPWDLVFVDADKAGYVGYVRHLLDAGKLAPGAVVVADNVAAGGRIGDPPTDGDAESLRGLRAYHDLLTSEPRLVSNVLPIGDGLAVSVVR